MWPPVGTCAYIKNGQPNEYDAVAQVIATPPTKQQGRHVFI